MRSPAWRSRYSRKLLFLAGIQLACSAAVSAQTSLTGAGATFPAPIYQKWFSEYHKQHDNVAINYQSVGSGAGIRQIIAGTVDFGASYMPMTDKQLQEAKQKILNIPTVLGAVVPAYAFRQRRRRGRDPR